MVDYNDPTDADGHFNPAYIHTDPKHRKCRANLDWAMKQNSHSTVDPKFQVGGNQMYSSHVDAYGLSRSTRFSLFHSFQNIS